MYYTENGGISLTYALLSDIHGNLPALQAVVDDATAQGADRLLLLGDYYGDVPWLPWPNETVGVIRSLDNAVAIRGNKEAALAALFDQNQSGWTYEQFAPLYWNYRALTPDNLNWLTALPETAQIENIHVEHRMKLFFRKPIIEAFHSHKFPEHGDGTPFSHTEYLAHARKALHENAAAMSEIAAMPGGVYAFGHNHLQFHTQIGDKLFVNPGSCGSPMDRDARAPYTLLERTKDGWAVDERRVEYDVEAVIAAAEACAQSGVWRKIAVSSLRYAKESLNPLFVLIEKTAEARGYDKRPVGNEIWREAAERYIDS